MMPPSGRWCSCCSEAGLADGLLGIGHRVVHGGSKFSGSMAITPEVVAKIEECIPLGPLHNPPNLLGIQVAQELFPGKLQVAVFDTAFHQTMPPVAYTYPVPLEWLEQHGRPPLRLPRHQPPLRRPPGAGADRAPGRRPRPRHRPPRQRLLVHRGPERQERGHDHGPDPARGRDDGDPQRRRSTPPSSATWPRRWAQPAKKILDALNKQSGLLGVCGLSNDMRTVEEAAVEGQRARPAGARHLLLRPRQGAGGAGGPAGPARRPGVHRRHRGELDPGARARRRAARVPGAGARSGPQRRARPRRTRDASPATLRPQAVVVPTNEELMIAMDTAEIAQAGGPRP